MPLAKKEHKAPIEIAGAVADKLTASSVFEKAEAVKPGFLNLDLAPEFVAGYVREMLENDKFGFEPSVKPGKIMIDYGGPNVAKPLHVGHLRSAIIGESVKRLLKFAGHEVIGDVHLGDWGLQMGLIITELRERKPELIYFDESFEGEYPDEAPFTIAELEEIYPTASAKSKEDEEYKKRALIATKEVQSGRRGYRALLEHILSVSVTDLKKNYERLGVSFELWKGESDAQEYIPDMVENMKAKGFAYESEGALVVDVSEESDSKEVPPCIILKSDGSALYSTTDLATLIWRMKDYNPDHVIYVVDKRQQLHFTQLFRCAKKTGIVSDDTKLTFLGFGTMNGKDGKPFKTREGGVMRLEMLLDDTDAKMLEKIVESGKVEQDMVEETAKKIALAAIKYGDLSNQASKDYVFDLDRFTSFEGNTGPYILYTIVRIKSIIRKYTDQFKKTDGFKLLAPNSDSEKKLMMEMARFSDVMEGVCAELAPHKLCAYLYDLSDAFNHFYHETPIISEEDEGRRESYIALLLGLKSLMETAIDLLGFEAPEQM